MTQSGRLTNEDVDVPEAPRIDGLRFRSFAGPSDYPAMVQVLTSSVKADGVEWTMSADFYEHLDKTATNTDPYKDRLMTEVDGRLVGFTECMWYQVTDGPRHYRHIVHLLPEWRVEGLRRALLLWNEKHIREMAKNHPGDFERLFYIWVNKEENDMKRLVISEGYRTDRCTIEMLRPNLDDIPDLALPDGVETRPVTRDHLSAIWETYRTAMRDHPEYSEQWFSDDQYRAWISRPDLDPSLWQIAWAGDKVVGMVRTYIDEHENERLGYKRGHTEHICVAREWRKKGIATALISLGLKALKERGMEGAMLDVDSENPSGAPRIYRSLGFEPITWFQFYVKPIDP